MDAAVLVQIWFEEGVRNFAFHNPDKVVFCLCNGLAGMVRVRYGLRFQHESVEIAQLTGAVDDAVPVLVVVDLHAVDEDLHGADSLQKIRIVEDEQERTVGHIGHGDRDGLVAGVGPAVVEDHVVGVLIEVDGLDVL